MGVEMNACKNVVRATSLLGKDDTLKERWGDALYRNILQGEERGGRGGHGQKPRKGIQHPTKGWGVPHSSAVRGAVILEGGRVRQAKENCPPFRWKKYFNLCNRGGNFGLNCGRGDFGEEEKSQLCFKNPFTLDRAGQVKALPPRGLMAF